jgi:hypothetical protein
MRYTPSSPKERWSGLRDWSRRRRFIVAAFALSALILILLLTAPARHDGEFTAAFYRETADLVRSGLGLVLLAPLLIAFSLLLLLIVYFWLSNLFSDGRGVDRALEKLLPYFGRAVLLLVPLAMVLVIGFGALRAYVTPEVSEHKIARVAALHATTSPLLLNLGTHALTAPEARLSGTFLALGDNVISIAAFPPLPLFKEPVEPISDLLSRGDELLVITGRKLFQIDRAGNVGLLARLPLDAMRLGAFAEPRDVSAKILLTGNKENAGYVFELTSEQEYSKLAELDAPVIGAAGCLDDVAIAVADRVLLVSPGRLPRLLFRRPQNDPPFTSIRARWVEGMTPPCLWLFATQNQIYLHQDGLNLLLATGLGGLITDTSLDAIPDGAPSLRFTLLDAPRRTIVDLTLDRRPQ